MIFTDLGRITDIKTILHLVHFGYRLLFFIIYTQVYILLKNTPLVKVTLDLIRDPSVCNQFRSALSRLFSQIVSSSL